MSENITLSRDVHYILTEEDVKKIRYNRDQSNGLVYGTKVDTGEHVTMKVTRLNFVNDKKGLPTEIVESINGQCLLDGNDSLFVQNVQQGAEPGSWHWPERAVAPKAADPKEHFKDEDDEAPAHAKHKAHK